MLTATRKGIVGEGGVGAHEHIVFQGDSVPDLDAALDGDAISEAHIVLDERMVADVAGGADHSAGQDVGKRPDAVPRPPKSFRRLPIRVGKNPCQPTRTPARALVTRPPRRIFQRPPVRHNRAASGSRRRPARSPAGVSQRPRSARGLLEVIRHGVVDIGGNAALLQRGSNPIARLAADHIEMRDVAFAKIPRAFHGLARPEPPNRWRRFPGGGRSSRRGAAVWHAGWRPASRPCDCCGHIPSTGTCRSIRIGGAISRVARAARHWW